MMQQACFPLFFLLLCVLGWYGTTSAACANACSGHGTCGQNNICTCFEGWNGGAADCSFRTCPTGPAWADKAYETDKAHLATECSNAGICDRGLGQCSCFDGFTGSACQRNICPNDCNSHGTCVSIADVSLFYGMDYDTSGTVTGGDGVGVVYTNWDKDSITMCECDGGYFGADCSLHMCPKGDDPLTINQNYRKIRMTLTAGSAFGGDLGFTFQGATTFMSLASPSAENCKRNLEGSHHIGTISCVYSVVSATEWYYDITFHTWPTLSRANNLYNHDGNPLITEFSCVVNRGTPADVACAFSDMQVDNVREYAYCSNRGNCDFNSGLCDCNAGYGGAACSNSTFFYSSGSNALPGMQVLADGLDYTGDVLQIRSAKSASPDFYLIEAIADKQRMFFVRGDGAVGITNLITPGGVTISSGGLKVNRGGQTIEHGGLMITDSGAEINDLVATSAVTNVAKINCANTGSVSATHSVLEVSTSSTATHYLISGTDKDSNKVFSVKNSGLTEVHQGGLFVNGGVSVNTGGASVYDGLTVASGGLKVDKVGIEVTEGGIIGSGGLHIKAGGVQVDSGSFKLMSAGIDVVSGGLRVHAGIAQTRAGLWVTSGHTVWSGGMTVTGGFTVRNNGIQVEAGGIQVEAGGLSSTGGLTVEDVGLRVVAGGISVIAGGADVTGGLTVRDVGLEVKGGGADVTGGLTVRDVGLQVIAGGADVTGGLTVRDTGIEVISGGLKVTGGLTVYGATGFTLGATTFTGSSNGPYANGGNQYVLTTSDRRLKTSLQGVDQPLEKISRLKGVYYKWTKQFQDESGYDDRRHIGFMAQDVLDVVPEAVHELKDEKSLGVDYSALLPVVINGVNELSDRIGVRDLKQQELVDGKKGTSITQQIVGLKQENRLLKESLDALTARLEKLEQR